LPLPFIQDVFKIVVVKYGQIQLLLLYFVSSSLSDSISAGDGLLPELAGLLSVGIAVGPADENGFSNRSRTVEAGREMRERTFACKRAAGVGELGLPCIS
jgi:hypothetical protein